MWGRLCRYVVDGWRTAASNIQRWYRAVRIRHVFMAVVHDAVVDHEQEEAAKAIQVSCRCFLCILTIRSPGSPPDACIPTAEIDAVPAQRLVRGYFQRRWMAWVLTCTITMQRAARGYLARTRLKRLCAIRIQARMRGYLQRKFNRYSAAAVVAQTHLRRIFAKWRLKERASAAWVEATTFEDERRAQEEAVVAAAGEAAYEEMSPFFAGRVVVGQAEESIPGAKPGEVADEQAEGADENKGDVAQGDDEATVAQAKEAVAGSAEAGSTAKAARAPVLAPASGAGKVMNTKAAAEEALRKGVAAMGLRVAARVEELVGQQRNVLSRAQDVVNTDVTLSSKERQRRIAVMKLVAGADNCKVSRRCNTRERNGMRRERSACVAAS